MQKTTPASKMLKLIIENSKMKQELLRLQISEIQFQTRQAIEEEARGLANPVAGFSMDTLEFVEILPDEVSAQTEAVNTQEEVKE